MTLVGVTGTNGKTTVTYLLEQILTQAGHRPGVVGTINYRYAGQVFDNPVTTPESWTCRPSCGRWPMRALPMRSWKSRPMPWICIRVDGCRFDVAVFTNLTQDHLDHHGTWSATGPVKKGCSPTI
jgi:UDP-N-acetylmuramyl tripeptide synthase